MQKKMRAHMVFLIVATVVGLIVLPMYNILRGIAGQSEYSLLGIGLISCLILGITIIRSRWRHHSLR